MKVKLNAVTGSSRKLTSRERKTRYCIYEGEEYSNHSKRRTTQESGNNPIIKRGDELSNT